MFANLKIILVFFLFSNLLPHGCDEAKTSTTSSETPSEVSEVSTKIPENDQTKEPEHNTTITPKVPLPGAHQWFEYRHLIKDKTLALVVNQTSRIEEVHLVDFLLEKGIKIQKIFAPEHGFRGQADAGEQIKDGKDLKTGIPLISLYGKKKKPIPEDLAGIDMILFDIQDVGARFYTYISSMHYVMEACAENDIEFLVLDRPNPNGHYVDGPILEPTHQSFVGMHPIPIVHGMTIAEYAQMINGEGWLVNGVKCNLQWVVCENYTHDQFYELPIKPSPNLPNMRSIYLYPSLCLFEGTDVNVGRGTDKQFQLYGHPDFRGGNVAYTPRSMAGAKYPKHENKKCFGFDHSEITMEAARNTKFDLNYLVNYYQEFPNKEDFFLKNRFFDKLSGSEKLRHQIQEGKSIEEIRASWQTDLSNFKAIRKKYLLYKDFE